MQVFKTNPLGELLDIRNKISYMFCQAAEQKIKFFALEPTKITWRLWLHCFMDMDKPERLRWY